MLNAVIDISHHNAIEQIGKVQQAGILGIIHKASQGTIYKDPTFDTHRKIIQDAGLLFGAYHFGTAGDPGAQADLLLSVAGSDTLLVLDLEPNPQGHDMSITEAEQFVHHIFTVTGRYPGLYSGHTIKEAFAAAGITNASQTELSKCWLWIAQYGPAPLIPKVWDRWTLWQYTDGAIGQGPHEVDGIGRCDRDQFNGTEEELRSFWAAAPVAITSVDDPNKRVLFRTTPMMRGEDVKRIQQALGFSGDDLDGFFGDNTDSAVREFQKSHGLKVDGVVGPDTWGTLLS